MSFKVESLFFKALEMESKPLEKVEKKEIEPMPKHILKSIMKQLDDRYDACCFGYDEKRVKSAIKCLTKDFLTHIKSARKGSWDTWTDSSVIEPLFSILEEHSQDSDSEDED